MTEEQKATKPRARKKTAVKKAASRKVASKKATNKTVARKSATKKTAAKKTTVRKKATKKATKKVAVPRSISIEERHKMIEEAAYYRAQRREGAEIDPMTDWLEAESEVDAMILKAHTADK